MRDIAILFALLVFFAMNLFPQPVELKAVRIDERPVINGYQFNFWSADHRKLVFNMEYEFGGFYGGNMSQLELGIGFSHRGYIKIGLSGIFVKGSLPEGDFIKNLLRARADFYLNPDLALMNYVQYDNVSETIGANIRLVWRISPGNTLYLVYNKGWSTEYDTLTGFSTGRFYSYQERGVFKIQLTWRP